MFRRRSSIPVLTVLALGFGGGSALATQVWTMHPDPVLDVGPAGAWDANNVSGPSVVNADGTYMMWYDGRQPSDGGDIPCIGLATSLDGTAWEKYAGNPVLGLYNRWPWVLFEPEDPLGHVFKMWWNAPVASVSHMKYAWSSDGITWNGEQTLFGGGAAGSFDDLDCSAPAVIHVGSTYYMYYRARSSAGSTRSTVALATSPDGIAWTKFGPILYAGPAGAWDSNGLNQCSVLCRDGLFEMWYTGEEPTTLKRRIGYAASFDGVYWTKYPGNPVLSGAADPTAWNYWVHFPSVLFDGGVYKMWLSGCRATPQPVTHRIGYAATSSGNMLGLEYLAHLQDNFENPQFTAGNWFIWSPTWESVPVAGGTGLQGKAGPTSPNTGPEAIAVAARGGSFMVDGLHMRTSLKISSVGGGVYFGGDTCVAKVPPLGQGAYQLYYVAVSPLLGGLELVEMAGGSEIEMAAAYIPGLSYDTWYDLEVVSTETNIQVWFGSKGGALAKVIDVVQDVLHPGTQAHSSGIAGVFVENDAAPGATMQFDNFEVQGVRDPTRGVLTGNARAALSQPCLVPVSISDAEGVAQFQFDLYFHTAYLSALAEPYVQKGYLIASDPHWQVTYSVIEPGHVRVTGQNTLSQPLPAGAWGELARLWFQVNPSAPTDDRALLDVQGLSLSDRFGGAIAARPYDGIVYVVGAGYPQVSITSPANGATVKGTVTVSASASDADGIQKVQFYDGTTLKVTDTAAPYQWAWDTKPGSVAEGWHTVTAIAYDNTGLTSQVSIAVKVDNATFDDVPKTSSQWPYVEALVRAGITSGCSTAPPLYCPLASVSRAQMAVFIVRAMGQTPYDKATATFTDVPKTHSAYGYIERLYALGITGGCSTSPMRYCPDLSVNRSQMAVFLCRAAGKAPLTPGSPTFADVSPSASFYGYVERLADPASWDGTAVTTGYATGPPRLYCPYSPVTRGQMAVFLCRAFGITL